MWRREMLSVLSVVDCCHCMVPELWWLLGGGAGAMLFSAMLCY